MTSAETHAAILRDVAIATVKDAKIARQAADASPTDGNLKAAYGACILAARALRRASMEHPAEELAMIERSIMLDEVAYGLLAKISSIAPGA